MASKKIRILIADDHPYIRAGIKQILEDDPDLCVTDEVGDGQAALDRIRRNSYELIILDISMPGMNGIDTLKQIKVLKPGLPVLILSMYPEDQYAIRAIRAGAAGYLTKDSAPENLVNAIRKIVEGGRFVTPSLAERLVMELETGSEKPPHTLLSDREYEIFCMIASGMTVSEIAQKLFLSIKTISSYRTRIMEKMNMKNNSELIYYAVKNKIVE